jgi:hypothetical protein
MKCTTGHWNYQSGAGRRLFSTLEHHTTGVCGFVTEQYNENMANTFL